MSESSVAIAPPGGNATDPVRDPGIAQWITRTFQAGHSLPSMLQQLTDSGWSDFDARRALHAALCDAGAPPVQARREVELPDVAGADLPCLDLDRPVRILFAMRRPRIVLFGNLLGADECEALIALARTRMQRSTTVDQSTGASIVHEARTSRGMFFEPGENDLVGRIEARIARLLAWPLERGEGMQVLCYDRGAQYKPHYDYFTPGPAAGAILERGGQRVGSLVMYLNEPAAGGATVFSDVELSVTPQRGNAVFFSYAQAHPSSLTLHGGAPVQAGEKWVATKWLRRGRFI